MNNIFTKSRLRSDTVIVILILVLITGLIWFIFHPRQLIEKSTLVANTGNWLSLPRPGARFSYQWIDNASVLIAHASEQDALVLYRYGIENRNEIQLVPLNKYLNATLLPGAVNRKNLVDAKLVSLSPDGKWLLWEGKEDGKLYRFCATLDGQNRLRWDWNGTMVPPCYSWLLDSNRWVEFTDLSNVNHGCIIVHKLDGQTSERVNSHFASKMDALGDLFVSSDYRDVCVNPISNSGGDKELSDSIINGQCARSRLDSVIFENISLNQQKRLARIKYEGKIARVLVSRADGSWEHEVGQTNFEPGPNALRELLWLPDGKRLSFIYKQKLYVVPAE